MCALRTCIGTGVCDCLMYSTITNDGYKVLALSRLGKRFVFKKNTATKLKDQVPLFGPSSNPPLLNIQFPSENYHSVFNSLFLMHFCNQFFI